MTTTKSLGFRVTGYVFKDDKGQVVEKEYKPHDKAKEEHLPGIFEKLLKSNMREEVNWEALEFFKKRA
jgi:hypothetical protein